MGRRGKYIIFGNALKTFSRIEITTDGYSKEKCAANIPHKTLAQVDIRRENKN